MVPFPARAAMSGSNVLQVEERAEGLNSEWVKERPDALVSQLPQCVEKEEEWTGSGRQVQPASSPAMSAS